METIKFIDGGVCAPKGFLANGINCGIRKNKSALDLALISSQEECDTAAVYTKNIVCGAPIFVTKENIKDGKSRALICNSGIANTCNSDGVEKAYKTCEITAKALGLKSCDIIVASTGVIGVPLPIEPIQNSIAELSAGLSADGSSLAAKAIMTTDTVIKEVSAEFYLGDKLCKIGAVSKGSGMINPNMATMLCFVTTDVKIDGGALQKALTLAVDKSFNMLSIDGDTSTNDMVSVMANGLAENEIIDVNSEHYKIFVQALTMCCIKLAREMAMDGEGATKLIECKVSGAYDDRAAKLIAKSVINSSLVKTAMFGSDANWGRILCAMGYSGADFDVSKADVYFNSDTGSVKVCEGGSGCEFSESAAKAVLSSKTVEITIVLKDGQGAAVAFGCDLSYDYVKINGDYRT
ncbi:MAG: bifunctional glutamate N-acetyltransferase/amino-acid acetyltransferase ArgJ [Oscillospiraceae bacterium]|jgi:glutamate N-acetyltransferase/amino-acid N-acetyltransferase|nr:bifunctional glutamate N-acetyltransferase/amino-acid acetyltransferase ArgJ [Oscillospiraceae bacterium]